MNVIIVGAGVIGLELARRMSAKKHNVILIEQDAETARHAANRVDCQVEQASGNDPKVLAAAGLHKADALVAVTNSDELNMIICGVAESIAPNVRKIARVRNEDYAVSINASNEKTLGIDFLVHPDQEAAQAIYHAVEHGAVSDIVAFDNSPYQLICFTIMKGSPLDGTLLHQTRSIINPEIPFVIVSIEKEGKAQIPSGTTILTADMRISILTLPEHIAALYDAAGVEIKPLKKIALIGMGNVGKWVAARLFNPDSTALDNLSQQSFQGLLRGFKKFFHPQKKKRWELTIIDKDTVLTKYASEQYPQARTHRGDVTDDAFIEEIGLTSFDLVISATQNYELNMITSAYLKTLGIPKTIALVQSSIMSNIAYKIGIDVAIPFKDVTADTITSCLGGKNFTSVHTMGTGNLEIMELTISAKAKAKGNTLEEVGMHTKKEGLYGKFLVLLLTNAAGCSIPRGKTALELDDKLTLIVQTEVSEKIIKYFAGEK